VDKFITKVGIGVALLRKFEGRIQVLLGKRKGSHGEGEWAFPGGHMEHLESFKETAYRELEEELGVFVKFDNLVTVSIINLTEYAPKHYIDVGMTAEWITGDPQVMEPDKVEKWEWFNLSLNPEEDITVHLPSPRFATVDRVLDAAANYLNEGVAIFDKVDKPATVV